MRLWVLTNEYEPRIIGGLGVVATKLSFALARVGTEVLVLTQSQYPRVEITNPKGVRLIGFPPKSKFHSYQQQVFSPSAITSWLNKSGYSKPALIHIHSVQWGDLANYYKKNFRIPIVYTCHSLVRLEGGRSRLHQPLLKNQEKLLYNADLIITPSLWLKRKIEEFYPFCINKVLAIYHGIDLQKRAPHNNPYQLLFVGRFVKSKGLIELLNAITLLAKRYPQVRLDVVGTGSEKRRSQLRSLVRDLGITGKIRWQGYKTPKQVRNMYHSYGGVVVTSRQESFGLVALEAMATGIPLISTRSGGLAEHVDSSVAQIILNVNSTTIAKAIENTWKNTSRTRARVEAGRQRATGYRWPQVANRYKEVFLRLLR